MEPRSTFAFATPVTSETTLRAVAYSGIVARAGSSGPSTSMHCPPPATTLFAKRPRTSGYRTAETRPTPGNATACGAAARSAFRISSRADTFSPLRAEALARHRRQLALARPRVRDVRGEDPRQLPEEAIGPGARQHPPADPRNHALAQRHQALRGQLAAPGEQLVVQVDADRADVAARPAQRGREGKVGVLLRVDVRGEDRADGARDGHAIAVASAAAVDRAGVQAGRAADALGRVAVLPAREDPAAPVIDEHDVHRGAWAGAVEVRGVRGDRLPRGAAREQPEEDRQLPRRGNQLLHAHASDVDGRQRGAEVRIALVGADHHASRGGDGEVHAGEAGLGSQELLAQVRARRLRELLRIGEAARRSQLVVEQLPDLLLLEMDGRHHDVGRRLAAELHDALAEVRVHHLDALRLEVLVEMALLGEHRLALHQARHAILAQDPVHDAVVLVGIARPMHRRAGALVIGDPVAAHRAGDRLLGDGEGPAEPAALVGARELGEPQAVDAFEQRTHLGEPLDQPFAAAAEPQLAKAVAAVVQADLVREAPPRTDLKDVVQELAELAGLRAQRGHTRVAGQDGLEMVAHHAGAAPGGTDHVLERR